jgi:aminopeptidase YwaD
MSRLVESTRSQLETLCMAHPDRHVGGPGVTAANDLFAEAAEAAGFTVDRLAFDCVDWKRVGAHVVAGGAVRCLHVGPYSPPFEGRARLVAASTLEAIESADAHGAVLLLHGQIAAEQITPRNYPFYQMDEHTRLLQTLDRVRPAAIIAATDRSAMAAALHPFPLFEDADLGFPSAYLTVEEGGLLLAHAGEEVSLTIVSSQIPAASEQLVARRDGLSSRRVIVSAHIDSRHGTPGALDNAAGVVVLLALAELLRDTTPRFTVELVPFNGEDNFAAYGEMAYLAADESAGFDDVVLAINLDALGRCCDTTAISFYGVGEAERSRVMEVAERFDSVSEGPEWPMSDHMVFAMRGVPAMAVTSSGLLEIAATVAHTPADLPDLVDPALLVEAAGFVAAVIDELEG